MSAALPLRKLGLTILVVGLLALFLGPSVLAPRLGETYTKLLPTIRQATAIGLLCFLVGLVAGPLAIGGARCQRCSARRAPGSVLCAAHRRDLEQAARSVQARQERDSRRW